MAMSKKDFIALADMIRDHQKHANPDTALTGWTTFTDDQLDALAEFCRDQNSNFMRDRWLDYIAGKCGPNGGAR